MDDAAWQELLGRVREGIPDMLRDFLDELDHHEGYADRRISREDVERTALQAFDLFLTRLGDDADVPSAFPEALGRRRARQGVRIDQFTEAVRINFRLLWKALNRAAQPDLVDELVANGERVLNVVERYATEVQRAFLDETQQMAQFHRTARERALSRLFSGNADPDELTGLAELLGLRPDDVFEMFVGEAAALAGQHHAPSEDPEALSYEDGDLAYVFRPRRGTADWAEARPDLDGVHLSRVPGVARLADAAALARRLSRVRTGRGPFTLKEGFARLVGESVLEQVAGFEHELVGAFSEASPDEQARFVETLQAFMRTGSIQGTADELYLHRNTVFKRMRTLQELTGLDVARPRDAAIALLVLRPEGAGVDVNTPASQPVARRH